VTGSQTPPKMGSSVFWAEILHSSWPYEHRLSYRSQSILILRIFSILQNVAQYISPNYIANEIKLGSLLEPRLFSERENLMALGRSVGEGRALKFAHFEKRSCLAPPIGVMRHVRRVFD